MAQQDEHQRHAGVLSRIARRLSPLSRIPQQVSGLCRFFRHGRARQEELEQALRALEHRLRVLESDDEFITELKAAGPEARHHRLLVVYDLSSQPFSIGDVLVLQAGALVVREKYGLGKIDFALVYDGARPSFAPFSEAIAADSLQHHLLNVIPAAQFNPHHGSLFVFDSHAQAQRFVSKQRRNYHVWPSSRRLKNRDYLWYYLMNHLFHDHYQEHRTIPRLASPPSLARWAHDFYRKHAYPRIPVTVQIRNNPGWGTHRNTILEPWLDFFRHCEQRYPAQFVIICGLAEIDERLRRHPNVIVAKDHATSIIQDLALIDAAAMHLGASSGPATVAIFSEKPYLLARGDLVRSAYKRLISDERSVRFSFSTPHQRTLLGPETVTHLTEEFARSWPLVAVPPREQAATARQSA